MSNKLQSALSRC